MYTLFHINQPPPLSKSVNQQHLCDTLGVRLFYTPFNAATATANLTDESLVKVSAAGFILQP